jgi:NAD(P)-dependent dehydrogenase (short-subunit alcohol dehydrogenase family)
MNDRRDKYKNPVRAVLTGISDLLKSTEEDVRLEDSHRLDGKKVMVTGAGSGLGLATAVELAKRGAEVIMALRSGIPEKREEVKKHSGSSRVSTIRINLSDPGSFKPVCAELKRRFGRLDILVCNAAMVARNSRVVEGGLDEMFMVNYFSKFLLVNELIEHNVLNFNGEPIPRIIFVASESHRNPRRFEWDSFGRYEPYGIRRSVFMYGYYKLLLLTMANELSRRLNSRDRVRCSVFALCPGPVNSKLAREAPRLFQPLLKLVFQAFFRSPERDCRPVIYLAASAELEGKPIEYLFLMQRIPMDKKAVDPGNGRRLWLLSEKLREHLK